MKVPNLDQISHQVQFNHSCNTRSNLFLDETQGFFQKNALQDITHKVVDVGSAQQERGHLIALSHATTARREHTRGFPRVNATHAAKDRSPNRDRRHVPSVWLDNTPISMKAYANLA